MLNYDKYKEKDDFMKKRRINVDEINLTIDDIEFWSPHEYNEGGMRIYWSSSIGFGEYDIVKQKNNKENENKLRINGYSECMDREDDKEFTNKLLSLISEKLKIVE